MSGLDALSKIVLPALSNQDDSMHKLAVGGLIDIVDNLDHVQGNDRDARARFLYDPNTGVWRQLQFISSCGSAAGNAEEPSADTTVAGYFVDTRSDEERKAKGANNQRRTFADRRERLLVTFKVLSLMGSINKRDPDWEFASPRNCIRNFFNLNPSEVVKCLKIRVSKEYFANDWGETFTKSIATKRLDTDKAVQKAKKKYGEVVRRNLVIEDLRQLESLKELYAQYAPQ